MSLQVSSIRGDKVSFFVSYVRPHKSVTARTLARWMQQTLTKAGVNPQIWAPHSVRAAASSHHSTAHNLDLGQICKLADWSMASGVYKKFYKWYVWHNDLLVFWAVLLTRNPQVCSSLFSYGSLWYLMIFYNILREYILENIIFRSYIWMYIFSPIDWCSFYN